MLKHHPQGKLEGKQGFLQQQNASGILRQPSELGKTMLLIGVSMHAKVSPWILYYRKIEAISVFFPQASASKRCLKSSCEIYMREFGDIYPKDFQVAASLKKQNLDRRKENHNMHLKLYIGKHEQVALHIRNANSVIIVTQLKIMLGPDPKIPAPWP